MQTKGENFHIWCTVVHDFKGHEVNGIHGLCGKKGYAEALHSVNKRHSFTGIHCINRKFPYNDIFCKNHAQLYLKSIFKPSECFATWCQIFARDKKGEGVWVKSIPGGDVFFLERGCADFEGWCSPLVYLCWRSICSRLLMVKKRSDPPTSLL